MTFVGIIIYLNINLTLKMKAEGKLRLEELSTISKIDELRPKELSTI